MITDEEVKMLYDKVDEIKAIKNAGESTFTALSYLKSFINKIMFSDQMLFKKEKKNGKKI